MTASETNFPAFRTRFLASASYLTKNIDDARDAAAATECSGGCIRGLLWAVFLEGAGLLTIACLVHALRAFHG